MATAGEQCLLLIVKTLTEVLVASRIDPTDGFFHCLPRIYNLDGEDFDLMTEAEMEQRVRDVLYSFCNLASIGIQLLPDVMIVDGIFCKHVVVTHLAQPRTTLTTRMPSMTPYVAFTAISMLAPTLIDTVTGRLLFTFEAIYRSVEQNFIMSAAFRNIAAVIEPAVIPPGIIPPVLPAAAASHRMSRQLEPVKPNAFYGLTDSRTPKGFDFLTYDQQNIDYVNSVANATEEERYLFYASQYQATALAYRQEFEKLYVGVDDRTVKNLSAFVRPQIVPATRAQDALNKLKALKMKSPPTFQNFHSYRTEFETHRRDATLEDDYLARDLFLKGLTEPVRKQVITSELCPPSIDTPTCIQHDGVTPFLVADLVQLTEISVQRMNALFRANQKRPASEDTVMRDNKGGKRQKGGGGKGGKGAQMHAVVNNRPITPFPKHERGTTVGKNGAFRDGSPRTCNGCNSPDHLFHDCTRQRTSPQMQNLGKHAVVLTKKQAKMAFAALNSMSADAAVGAGEPSSASGSAMAPTTPSQRPSVVSGNVLSQDASGQTASNASRLASLLSTLSSSRDISNRRQ